MYVQQVRNLSEPADYKLKQFNSLRVNKPFERCSFGPVRHRRTTQNGSYSLCKCCPPACRDFQPMGYSSGTHGLTLTELSKLNYCHEATEGNRQMHRPTFHGELLYESAHQLCAYVGAIVKMMTLMLMKCSAD